MVEQHVNITAPVTGINEPDRKAIDYTARPTTHDEKLSLSLGHVLHVEEGVPDEDEPIHSDEEGGHETEAERGVQVPLEEHAKDIVVFRPGDRFLLQPGDGDEAVEAHQSIGAGQGCHVDVADAFLYAVVLRNGYNREQVDEGGDDEVGDQAGEGYSV